MPANDLHICDYTMQTLGTLTLQSTGPSVSISGAGEDTSVQITAETAIGAQAGAALLTLVNDEDDSGTVTLQGGALGTVSLGVGEPEIGSFIKVMPELISISVGAPGVGASIKMTPESITFAVGEITFTMTPAGIIEEVMECSREVTAEGHNFLAAETEFNVGVAGEAKEAPTAEGEIEGGSVQNETMGSDTSDAMKNADAGIMMQV